MFGNLKNKLGEAADLKKYAAPQNLVNSLMGSRQRSGTQTPSSVLPTSPSTNSFLGGLNNSVSSHAPHTQQSSGSGTPLPSFTSHSPLSPASSRTHSRQASITSPPLSPGMSPTPPAVIEDNNVSPHAQQDMAREVKKLRAALEQQQDAHLNRLASKESEWKEKFARHADKVSHTQEALQKSEITIASLRGELHAANNRVDELVQRLQSVQDDRDQLEGLSVQEAAKIKHMLLNTSTELEATRAQLSERISLYGELEKQLQSVQSQRVNEVQKLQFTVQQLQQQLHDQGERRQQDLRTGGGASDDVIAELQLQHSDRENSLMCQIEDLRSENTRLHGVLREAENVRAAEEARCSNLLQQEKVLRSAECEGLRRELCRERERLERNREEVERKLGRVIEEYKEELERMKAEEEKRRQQLESEVSNLQEQLCGALSKVNDVVQQEQAARTGQEAANSRCEELQTLLQEVQDKMQEQLSMEKDKNEKLQLALSSERTEKHSLEAIRSELETKLQTYSSEKTKLSQHLDEYAARVSALEQQSAEDTSCAAALQEELQETREQLQQCRDHLEYYESSEHAQKQQEQAADLQELREKVGLLEEQLEEKSQTIKVQAQRIVDMKKTMQRELRLSPDSGSQQGPRRSTSPSGTGQNRASINSGNVGATDNSRLGSNNSPAILSLSNSNHTSIGEVPAITRDGLVDPINLEYLKHVMLKFITTREDEAVQLTNVVSTLLHLTSAEKKFLKDTLSSRTSWFGSKPTLR